MAVRLPFGIVNAPGQRLHPALVAQASAALAETFEERFWMALGTGQALNECITGDVWPSKEARVRECVAIIRALWRL